MVASPINLPFKPLRLAPSLFLPPSATCLACTRAFPPITRYHLACILHALKLTHQSLGPLLFHKYASPNHSSFRFETSQEAKLHPPRQDIVNSRHVSLHRNAKKAIQRLAAALQLRPQEEGEEFSAAVARVTNKHGVSPLSLKQSGGWLTRTERMSGAESGRARLERGRFHDFECGACFTCS